MKVDRDKLEYRYGSQAYIVKGDYILITQEMQWNDNEWGFPGGKIEEGETEEQTIIRELNEEFPDNSFKIIKKSSITTKYEWPDEIILSDISLKGWSYRGQIRTTFWVKLKEKDINNYKRDEIKNTKWVTLERLHKFLVFPNQLQNTLKILREFELIK